MKDKYEIYLRDEETKALWEKETEEQKEEWLEYADYTKKEYKENFDNFVVQGETEDGKVLVDYYMLRTLSKYV